MVTISACDGYKDFDGNVIEGVLKNCKVIFKGKNSKLTVDKGFHAYGQNVTIVIENNCDVHLCENFQVGTGSRLFFRDGCVFNIGAHASFGNYTNTYCRGNVKIADHFCMREYSELRVHGTLEFDSWVYLQHHVTVYVPQNSFFSAGIDTGLSWYSKVIAGSGHSTYDLRHGIRFEDLTSHGSEDKKVVLGNHVWVGCGSTINNDVVIGDGSVVAANSIIYAGLFEKRVMISGNPAKVVAKDVTWDRRPNLTFDEFSNYDTNGDIEIKRPSFFDEYSDEGISDDYYMK